ncbi:MAG: hypothetical protein FRX49_03702 [Trebouxia sp. A1-2]|nr:MAG: hypothetical protein FRX49_03702 [Trebouxia sp. A1-2]
MIQMPSELGRQLYTAHGYLLNADMHIGLMWAKKNVYGHNKIQSRNSRGRVCTFGGTAAVDEARHIAFVPGVNDKARAELHHVEVGLPDPGLAMRPVGAAGAARTQLGITVNEGQPVEAVFPTPQLLRRHSLCIRTTRFTGSGGSCGSWCRSSGISNMLCVFKRGLICSVLSHSDIRDSLISWRMISWSQT